MNKQYFGTDGIRGTANQYPMTAEIAMRLGMAAGRTFIRGDHRHRVVIGKDTRLSGYMIEPALVAGFTAVGMDVFQFGPLPTPAVAMLTRSLRADLGVMISASHNAYADNGIKLFGPDGFKLSDDAELEIENLMTGTMDTGLATPEKLGRATRIEDAQARYIEFVKGTFPKKLSLDDVKIVVDCANGAAYKVAPAALWELGADIIPVGVKPDGFNINKDCGSTAPQEMCATVIRQGADIGISLDGDADRVIICDEKGQVIDGDQLMALIGTYWLKAGMLNNNGLVATIMSNLGMERYLGGLGVNLIRAKVGDRYVVEEMRKGGFNVGGEQSGHIVLSDFTTTGDGLIAALQVLAVVKETGRPVSEVCKLFDPFPQVLKNVRYMNGSPLELDHVKSQIDAAQARLGNHGRLVIRNSGTEPLIRVMGEGEDAALVNQIVDEIVYTLEQVPN